MQHHLPLVPPLVKLGLPEMDMLIVGTGRLWRAVPVFLVEEFDHAHPQRFQDYAANRLTEAFEKLVKRRKKGTIKVKLLQSLPAPAVKYLETLGYTNSTIRDLRRYKAALQMIPLLSVAEEHGLFARYDRVIKILWQGHMYLAEERAKSYAWPGISTKEFIQEGHLALRTAVIKFDPQRASLRTYARPWLDEAMRRLIREAQDSGRGFTASRVKELRKYRKTAQALRGLVICKI